MGKRLGRVLVFQALLAIVAAAAACNKSKNNNAVGQGFGNEGGPPAGMGGDGPARPRGPIGEIMSKIGGKGQSMTQAIGNELSEEPTPWDKIQPQAKEYARLIASLAQYDPPRGSKESWTKLTAAFAESAAALDRAAEAKNIDDALSAHGTLTQLCMACHRQHRGGRGGMGMPPGGFRGRGGPPGGPDATPQ